MAHKPNLTLQIESADLNNLRWLAAQSGLTIGRGSVPEMGSIRAMLLDLAGGVAAFVPLKEIDLSNRDTALIRDMGETHNIPALVKFADALDRASSLYDGDSPNE
jgi:hypothetical protein